MTDSALTAIVLTLNEEQHLPDCLASLRGLTSDVIVVDSGSSDATVTLANSLGATTVTIPFQGYASQRNAALRLAHDSEWVLFVDADERLTESLVNEIRESISTADPDTAGFWIPRRNLVVGRPLSGGGWWPDYQARLLRRERAHYDPTREVHEVVVFDGPTAFLREPMLHINYESWREILHRQRAYTHRKARAGQIPRPGRISWVSRPTREFYRRFVRLRGYRDGSTGLLMAAILALEELRGCILMRRVDS